MASGEFCCDLGAWREKKEEEEEGGLRYRAGVAGPGLGLRPGQPRRPACGCCGPAASSRPSETLYFSPSLKSGNLPGCPPLLPAVW